MQLSIATGLKYLKVKISELVINKSIFILLRGSTFSQLIILLSSPILTRIYSPQDFGMIANFVSVITIILVISSLRYEFAIPLAEDDDDAVNLLVLCLLLVVFISIISILFINIFSIEIREWIPINRFFLYLLPLSILGAGINQVFSFWMIRVRSYNYIAKTKISQSISQVVTQILFGVSIKGPFGLFIGDFFGRVGGNITYLSAFISKEKDLKNKVTIDKIINQANKFYKFPLISLWSALINNVGVQAPNFVLAYFYGLKIAGFFALGQRLIGAPLQLIGQSVSQVYIGEISKIKDCKTKIQEIYIRTAKKLFLIGFLPIVLLILLGPYLFNTFFGHNWSQAGEFVRYLGLMFLIQFIVVPISSTLTILDRQEYQLLWDIFRLVIIVVGIYFVYYLEGEPVTAVFTYSILMVITYSILFILPLFLLKE